jgi:glycosyltransferase involved in cell wall biosynthesis
MVGERRSQRGSAVPAVSVVTTCKSRLQHLRQSLPRMLALPGAEVVLVDYGCPEASGDWARRAHPEAKVVTVADDPTFRLARARNLGAAAASAEWLLFLDADTLPSPDLMTALSPLMASGAFATALPRIQDLWGALLVRRADFDAVGGYDEAFEGWGSEDEDIGERLADAGVTHATFDAALLEGLRHDNALRVMHHDVKDIWANNCINFVYRTAKRDLTRLGAPLPLSERRRLYAEIKAAALRENGGYVDVTYRQRTVGPHRLTGRLRYDITPDPDASAE